MTEEYFTKLGQSAQQAVSRLHVRSALNPMLWLSGISMLLCFPSAFLFRDNTFLCTVLVLFPLIVCGITAFQGLYFGFKNPNKLQSEDYQIRHEAIELIAVKGGRIPAGSLEAIANPATRLLEKGGLDEK